MKVYERIYQAMDDFPDGDDEACKRAYNAATVIAYEPDSVLLLAKRMAQAAIGPVLMGPWKGYAGKDSATAEFASVLIEGGYFDELTTGQMADLYEAYDQ